MSNFPIIRLATRGSALALWQANRVGQLIQLMHPDYRVENVVISTKPDRIQDRPLHAMGGDKGLFVKEVEQAVLDGRADAAVHSLKDVPITDLAAGLELVAFPERADVHDVLLSNHQHTLATLPAGSRVATGAPRRQGQLLAQRPDLQVVGVRGNVETRIRKLLDQEFDAIIMAAAGLKRLGLDHHIVESLPLEQFVPAPGQGIVVVQAPADSPHANIWQSINNAAAQLQAEAEREFSRLVGADCHSAAGCFLNIKDSETELRAVVCAPDGSQRVDVVKTGSRRSAMELVKSAVDELNARGAGELLGHGPAAG